MKAFAANTKFYQEGMDLRDYFAAKALPVLMHADSKPWEGHYEIHAEQAYKFADAMMKAREVKHD
jgi:hypothetical protein